MCTSPNLIRCYELNMASPDLVYRLKKLGYQVDIKNLKAYKFVPFNSRDLPLEEVPEYKNLEMIEIGCGGCIECRLEYSKNWANRCHLESKNSPFNYFITLTYNDESVTLSENGNMTLNREHFDEFIKAIRNKFKYKFNHDGVRYFACGEYGIPRPHYHLILFNAPIPDLTIDIQTDDGQIIHKKSPVDNSYYMWSQFVKDCWPYGNILIANANWNTSAYVSRYILKKITGEEGRKVYSEKLGILPPFLAMSRRPGIGFKYLDDHFNDFYEDMHLYIPRRSSCLVSSLPRYFIRKIKDHDAGLYQKLVDDKKDSVLKHRSLIAGQMTINKLRSDQEDLNKSKLELFTRNKF